MHGEQVVCQLTVLVTCGIPVAEQLLGGAREAPASRSEFGARLTLAAGNELAFEFCFEAAHVIDERGARCE